MSNDNDIPRLHCSVSILCAQSSPAARRPSLFILCVAFAEEGARTGVSNRRLSIYTRTRTSLNQISQDGCSTVREVLLLHQSAYWYADTRLPWSDRKHHNDRVDRREHGRRGDRARDGEGSCGHRRAIYHSLRHQSHLLRPVARRSLPEEAVIREGSVDLHDRLHRAGNHPAAVQLRQP